MRLGTSRKMPRKSTGLTDRLTLPMRPELLREIDQVRGDVPAESQPDRQRAKNRHRAWMKQQGTPQLPNALSGRRADRTPAFCNRSRAQ
jgi:hypothetical protein